MLPGTCTENKSILKNISLYPATERLCLIPFKERRGVLWLANRADVKALANKAAACGCKLQKLFVLK
jgi:hypothetical protein